jgi:Tfp pilus assembly protein PilF
MLMVCGDAASALTQYQIVAADRPDWAQLHDNMGVCYLRLHQPALAIELFQLTLALDPNAPLVRRHMAEAMVK